METQNAAPVAQATRVAVAPVEASRPQTAAPPALTEPVRAAQPDYTVNISAQARAVADTRAIAQSREQVKTAAKTPAPRAEAGASVAESSYAQFLVAKNNRVVMKLVNQEDNKVVKEVPSTEDRHIRDTVARLMDNGGNLLAPER
jgi:hypothetical protein